MLPFHVACLAAVVYSSQDLTLISSTMHYLQSQKDPQLFQDIVHPIALDYPHLFGSILQKLCENEHRQYEFAEFFIKTATFDIFHKYVSVNNKFELNPNFTTSDLWHLVHFAVNKKEFQKLIFKTFVHNITYKHTISKFEVITQFRFNKLKLNATIYGINWAHIPSYVTTLKIEYEQTTSNTVDLSAITQQCSVNELEIVIGNGTIILPQYSLPSTLTNLIFTNNGKLRINYRQLWSVGRHIETLCISDAPAVTDFVGIGNMENMKRLYLGGNQRDLYSYAKIIKSHMTINRNISVYSAGRVNVIMDPETGIAQEKEIISAYNYDLQLLILICALMGLTYLLALSYILAVKNMVSA